MTKCIITDNKIHMEPPVSFFKKLCLKDLIPLKKVQGYTLHRKEIAKGAASTVYYATNGGEKKELVMKTYSSRWIFDNEEVVTNELENFNSLGPLGLVPKLVHELLRTPNNMYIALEFCNCGSLDKHLKRVKRFPTSIIKDIAQFLSTALYQLKECDMLHGDINPQHILVNLNSKNEVSYKLTGLQCCRRLTKGKTHSLVGSHEYLAPEVVPGGSYNYKADTWSVGATLYELAMGANCLKIDPDSRVNIKAGKPPTFPGEYEINPRLKDLITKCLMYDPKKRPTLEELMGHPFLTERASDEVIVPAAPDHVMKLIKEDFAGFMNYINDQKCFLRKLEVQVRTNLDPYVLDSPNAIATGGFSDIYLCTNKETNVKYILKVIKKNKITDPKIATLVLGEVVIMLELNTGPNGICPFTIGLEDYFVYNNTLYMVLEYCNGGDMENFVRMERRNNSTLNHEQFKLLAWNVACGLSELHKRNIMHRDVKPKNILVIKDPNTDELVDLKLCDYGLSKQVAEYQEVLGSTILGTMDYFPPEMHKKMEDRHAGIRSTVKYTHKVDVWSYGVLLYFTAYGRTIMEPPGSCYKVMKKGVVEFPEVKDVPEGLLDLIKKTLKHDPNERPDFIELLNHPFFTTVVIEDRLTLGCYTQEGYIASGDNGFVRIYNCKKKGKLYAMKVMEDKKVERKRLCAEIDTLGKIRNSNNVVRLHDYFTKGGYVYIILSNYEGGDLETYIRRRHEERKYLAVNEATFLAYCILNGIKEIHLRNIIHRNIHPNNILLNLNPNGSVRNAVVAGFGFARILVKGEGTTALMAAYASPEMVLPRYKGEHNSKSDIWSYGMLLYYLIFGIHPNDYRGNNNLYHILTTGEVKYDKEHAKKYQDLIGVMTVCLMPDPEERPTASQLLSKMPSFRKYLKRVFL